jgi:hypothetical protein
MSFRRRRLAAVVLGTAVIVLAVAPGSYAGTGTDPVPDQTVSATPEPTDSPAPTPAATPAATPESTPESTPEATPESTPEATPEATPVPTDTPAATPEASPESAPAPIAASESSIETVGGGTTVAAIPPKDLTDGFHPRISTLTRADLPYTYRAGCPVGPSRLRLLQVTYLGFDHKKHRGEIVVNAAALNDVSAVFHRALEHRFPIRTMHRVDFFRGSDIRSMEHDNTSAFNCRHVTGNPTRLSQHSYGNAVDVNTRENPYVTGSRVYPSTSRTYLNRSNVRRGMLLRSGVIPREFARLGWPWGARWSHPDYQHFSSNGK